MTDAEIQDYLRGNGYPEHVVRGGRAGLIRRWREFVEQVERGYPLGLEDYRNDLDLRAIIAMAGAEDEDIRALDRRLSAMLVDTRVRVWESLAGDPFWDFGTPRNASGELLEDLRREGLSGPD
ncbi:MAG TPA: hypothetical protein VMG40_04250 [Bryobacteraceae bacterium]|nr:hypothetical protein [Bryobacteraceae bacterium]